MEIKNIQSSLRIIVKELNNLTAELDDLTNNDPLNNKNRRLIRNKINYIKHNINAYGSLLYLIDRRMI